MPRLIHLSDLHFGDILLNWGHLKAHGQRYSKQLLGLANHRFNASRTFNEEVKAKLIERLCQIEWDILVISGDLVHLGTDPEFKLARESLDPLIRKGKVLVTAGNHDRYTPATMGRIESHFADCYPFNEPEPVVTLGPGDWGFLELPLSAPSTLGAKGRFMGDLEVYRRLILERQGKPTILYGHYPLFYPQGISEGFGHRLWGQKEVIELTELPGVKAYLHGHMHQSWAIQPRGTGLWSINAGGSLTQGHWCLDLSSSDLSPELHQPPF